MNFELNTFGILLLSGLILFIITTIILYINNSKLNKEIIPLRNLKDSDYRKNEVKKLELNLHKENIDIEKNFIKEIADLKIKHSEEVAGIKSEFEKKKTEVYENAYEKGKQSVDFEVRITPIKNIFEDKGFFGSSKSLEIGYSHRLYINGIPCLDENEVIVERIEAKEINERNINNALDKIEKIIDKIPSSKMKIAGNTMKGMRNELKSEIPKKK